MSKPFAGWKYMVIAVLMVVGLLLALPNWYGKSPAVQMQFADAQAAQAALPKVEQLLKEHDADYRKIAVSERSVEILFAQTQAQLESKDWLAEAFPDTTVAINLLSNTPDWMQSFGLSPMNLGLDLRGGVSFLLQVDSNELFQRRSENLADLVVSTLKDHDLSYQSIEHADQGGAVVYFDTAAARDLALNELFRVLPNDIQRINVSDGEKEGVRLVPTEEGIAAAKRRAAEQNRIRMAGRVDSLGVAEPSIQVVGDDRILVQLPGIQDTARAKELLGSTATLEFYIVDETADVMQAARSRRAPFGSKLAYFEDGTPIVLKRRVVMSGEHIVDASAGFGQHSSQPQVNVVLDSAGGAQMAQITRENLQKPMATMYVEYLPVTRKDANGELVTEVEKRETVVNSATIQGQFSSNFQITGVAPMSRAQSLASTLRAGSLVAPVYIIEERTIGPSAGKQNIEQGLNASILGLMLVAIFMLLYYRKLGFFADIALAGNVVLLVGLMSLLGATLTLPGIAGIILTLGMAVDANVLIYERIREELQQSSDIKQAVRAGFDNALSTIVDANITTLIVAILLFSFGAGPIKGFAVTLSVGIITSMFTAIYVTRALIEFFLLRKKQAKLNM